MHVVAAFLNAWPPPDLALAPASGPHPRSGFNLRQTTRGSVTFKLWDLSGQPKFRPTWTRYCLGVGVLVFVVDAAEPATFAVARDELHSLLSELPGVVSLIGAVARTGRLALGSAGG